MAFEIIVNEIAEDGSKTLKLHLGHDQNPVKAVFEAVEKIPKPRAPRKEKGTTKQSTMM
jgi:hypothetical protein